MARDTFDHTVISLEYNTCTAVIIRIGYDPCSLPFLEHVFFFFFFFQAEDGIRDLIVTGVQTCALPISRVARDDGRERDERRRVAGPAALDRERVEVDVVAAEHDLLAGAAADALRLREIGRASCRERV